MVDVTLYRNTRNDNGLNSGQSINSNLSRLDKSTAAGTNNLIQSIKGPERMQTAKFTQVRSGSMQVSVDALQPITSVKRGDGTYPWPGMVEDNYWGLQ